MKKFLVIIVLFLVTTAVFTGCSQDGQEGSGAKTSEDKELILATTTSTYDSGLLDVLIPEFEKKSGYDVSILSKGTGASLELGKRGDCDVLLVHAKEREMELVEEGFFVDRRDVMYNDFIILGPSSDPAGISGMKDAAEAFSEIAAIQAEFASRGDESGTNMKELSIWDKAGISPQGDWYLSLGQGMGDTLRVANEKGAYTLADRGTYLSMKEKMDLEILVEGDPILFNQYGIMAVNPERHENVNYEGAKALIEFMVSQEGQQLIAGFKKYGEQLFVPNAR